jgi:hypothetical protein
VVKNHLTKSELLSNWEKQFGQLTESQRKEFRSRSELAELVRLPRNTVLGALSFGPRLANILSEALRLEGGSSTSTKSFDSYPESWVRLVTKYEKSTQMALGALAFRASMEEKRGRAKRGHTRYTCQTLGRRLGITPCAPCRCECDSRWRSECHRWTQRSNGGPGGLARKLKICYFEEGICAPGRLLPTRHEGRGKKCVFLIHGCG